MSGMLVLARKKNERILIGDNITIKVLDVSSDKVRLGIDAPRDVRVDREEVRIAREKGKKPDAAVPPVST